MAHKVLKGSNPGVPKQFSKTTAGSNVERVSDKITILWYNWEQWWNYCTKIHLQQIYRDNSTSKKSCILFPLLFNWEINKLDYFRLTKESENKLNFNFSEKGLGLVSPPHFVHDFSRKMFLMLINRNWQNFIVWLPLPLEILGNMCITIGC